MTNSYLIAVGSNRRHHLYGQPQEVVRAAMEELAVLGTVIDRSPVIASAPIGPAQRRFANAAAIVESDFDPPSFLAGLKRMEHEFGRRRGRRWGDRVLDLDIILWTGGVWRSSGLEIPHVSFRSRAFVLGPAAAIAPAWCDTVTGLSIRQLNARLTTGRALPR
ncbi:MAG: 2-amino-4-hydroxy-6-hydroxymethyldihydropteridine diphosphokinase [Pseudomonadota bacterium]